MDLWLLMWNVTNNQLYLWAIILWLLFIFCIFLWIVIDFVVVVSLPRSFVDHKFLKPHYHFSIFNMEFIVWWLQNFPIIKIV